VKPRKPKVRPVLLDGGFIVALLATDHPQHDAAVEIYATLVDRYEAGLDRLFALSTVLDDLPLEFRRSALAPALTLHVSGQHRSAARRVTGTTSEATALSMVMMRRERIHAIATTSHDFDDLDVEVLCVAPEPGEMSRVPAGYLPYPMDLSSGTAPMPAPQSTGGLSPT
jgi:predicted nucleic acid-binding protein